MEDYDKINHRRDIAKCLNQNVWESEKHDVLFMMRHRVAQFKAKLNNDTKNNKLKVANCKGYNYIVTGGALVLNSPQFV